MDSATQPRRMLPKVDRQKARALYLMGNEPKLIAEMLGCQHSTISQWVTRYGWCKEKRQSTVEATKTLNLVAGKTHADIIAAHQKLVHEAAESHIDSISKLKVVDTKQLVEVGQALKHLDDVARRNLGLSDAGTNERSINFNLSLAGYEPDIKPVVEVESSSTESQQIDIDQSV